jgi:hypothetical protein
MGNQELSVLYQDEHFLRWKANIEDEYIWTLDFVLTYVLQDAIRGTRLPDEVRPPLLVWLFDTVTRGVRLHLGPEVLSDFYWAREMLLNLPGIDVDELDAIFQSIFDTLNNAIATATEQECLRSCLPSLGVYRSLCHAVASTAKETADRHWRQRSIKAAHAN